jgi:hypothetical protein
MYASQHFGEKKLEIRNMALSYPSIMDMGIVSDNFF